MSLTTWKKEFYPTTAESAAKDLLSAARHSLLKWQGLLPKNLKRHGVVKQSGTNILGNSYEFCVTEGTCALCSLYRSGPNPSCSECPVVPLGGDCDYHGSAYMGWVMSGNPSEMIAVLQAVVDQEEAKLKPKPKRRARR